MTTDLAIVDAEVVELDAGTAKARMLVQRDDVSALVRADLVAAVFNMKGKPHPLEGHFKDWPDWEREADRHVDAMRQEVARLDGLIADADTFLPAEYESESDRRVCESNHRAFLARLAGERHDLMAQLELIHQHREADAQPRGRIALVPVARKRGTTNVIQFMFTPTEHEYVTHVAFGMRDADGTIRVLGGAQFDRPIAVLAHGSMRLGIRLTPGLQLAAGERLLPPSAFRTGVEDGRDRDADHRPLLSAVQPYACDEP